MSMLIFLSFGISVLFRGWTKSRMYLQLSPIIWEDLWTEWKYCFLFKLVPRIFFFLFILSCRMKVRQITQGKRSASLNRPKKAHLTFCCDFLPSRMQIDFTSESNKILLNRFFSPLRLFSVIQIKKWKTYAFKEEWNIYPVCVFVCRLSSIFIILYEFEDIVDVMTAQILIFVPLIFPLSYLN